MTVSALRLALCALATIAPVQAAHPTGTSPSPEGFADAFAAFGDAAPVTPVPGTVDMATIEHTHPSAASATLDAGAGRTLSGGVASYYGRQFDGRRTASGERFDMAALTAAHRTLPFGSKVRVTNPANGQSVVVRINDRGPFHKSRTIDVSHAAAARLGLIARGSGRVELALLD